MQQSSCENFSLVCLFFCFFQYKAVSIEKGQACERAKEEYRNQLEKTNNKQTLHYNTEMPAVFDVRLTKNAL